MPARVARTSGMLWNWTARGLREAARSLLKERQSPSQVYRLHAANSPDKTALVWRDQRLTFRELDDRLDRIGHALQRRGMQRGCDRFRKRMDRGDFILASPPITE